MLLSSVSLLLLAGCSGAEPGFIYTPEQFQSVNARVEKMTSNPLLKSFGGQTLSNEEQRNFKEALPLVEQMIQFDPISIYGYSLKGKIYLALGDKTKAREAFLDGMALSSLRPGAEQDIVIRADALVALAQLHVESGEYRLAETAAVEALGLYPESAPAEILVAQARLQEHDLAAASEHVMRALSIDNDYEPARVLLRQINAAKQEGAPSTLTNSAGKFRE